MDLIIQVVRLVASLASLATLVIKAVSVARGKRPSANEDRRQQLTGGLQKHKRRCPHIQTRASADCIVAGNDVDWF